MFTNPFTNPYSVIINFNVVAWLPLGVNAEKLKFQDY